MNSRVYIHHNKSYNILLKTILIMLIPFAIYGIYKNGVSLLLNNYNLFSIGLKPVYFLLISLIVSLGYSLIFKKEFISYNLLGNILIALITLPSTNILIYIILLLVVNIISKYLKINTPALYMVLLIIISFFLDNYSFLNIYEQSKEHIYVLIDYIMGKGAGGCGNTLLVFTIISFIILLSNKEYKKEIPILSLITYYILISGMLIFAKKFSINLFLNNNLLFAFIFIAPISIYSPYAKGSSYIYGAFLGLLAFAFSFLDLDFGIYFSILLLSLISPYIDKFIVGK